MKVNLNFQAKVFFYYQYFIDRIFVYFLSNVCRTPTSQIRYYFKTLFHYKLVGRPAFSSFCISLILNTLIRTEEITLQCIMKSLIEFLTTQRLIQQGIL